MSTARLGTCERSIRAIGKNFGGVSLASVLATHSEHSVIPRM